MTYWLPYSKALWLAGAFTHPTVFGSHSAILGERLGALVVHADQHVSQGQSEPLHQDVQVPMHARCVALNHQHGTVQVCNQPWHAVALGVDQAACILAVLAEQPQVFAHLDCICDFDMPPSFVGQGIVESHHAHGNACVGGIVTPAEACAFVGEDLDPIPALGCPSMRLMPPLNTQGAPSDALVALGFQGHARWLGSLVHAQN